MVRLFAALSIVGMAFACAKPPYQQPFQATRVAPDSGSSLQVDQVVVILDTSGSIDPQTTFPAQKAWAESFVAGMPEGSYEAEIVAAAADPLAHRDVELGLFVHQQAVLADGGLEHRAQRVGPAGLREDRCRTPRLVG